MAKSWRKRATRRVLGWLGRIEGVEKPAILIGFGLLLYRVWRGGKLDRKVQPPQRPILGRVRERLSRALDKERSSSAPSPPATAPRTSSDRRKDQDSGTLHT
jgi:hypothetical protein